MPQGKNPPMKSLWFCFFICKLR